MKKIHLIDGGIGSVGKSLFCRVLLQYCLDQDIPHILVEADLDNPDVARTYGTVAETEDGTFAKWCVQVTFERPDTQGYNPEALLDYSFHAPVIVNLPAQSFHHVNTWLEDTGGLAAAQANDITFIKWFVCNGRRDSISLFLKSLKHFGRSVPHILVCNLYFRNRWESVLENLNPVLQGYEIPVMWLPKLAEYERDLIEQNEMTFGDARRAQMKLLSRQRLHTFLKKSQQEIYRLNQL